MLSKYGFETDEYRRKKEEERQRQEEERKRAEEEAMREAREKQLKRLSSVADKIDDVVCDILVDFVEASPSYFHEIGRKSARVAPSGFTPRRGDFTYSESDSTADADKVSSEVIKQRGLPLHLREFSGSKEVFQTWMIARSLVVALAWSKESNQPELFVVTRTTGVPKAALEHLCAVLEKYADLPCTEKKR
jgi:hypothetical protein